MSSNHNLQRSETNGSEFLTDSDNAGQSVSSGSDPKFPLSIITKLGYGPSEHRTKSDLETHTGKKVSLSFTAKNITLPVTGHEKKKLEDINSVVHRCEPGFYNLGNSCYLNASLQCLLHSKCFVQQIKDHGLHLGESSHSQFCVLDQLYKLVQNYYNENAPEAMNLSVFVENMRRICPFFAPHQQQDADEFIQLLFQAIDHVQCNGCADAPFKNENYPDEIGLILRNSVIGYMKTTITCHTCQQSSSSRSPFTKLPIAAGSVATVEKSLAAFMEDEVLEGENAYQCPHCQTSAKAVIKKKIDEMPNLLILQLKRFDSMGKIDYFLPYPQVLDLHPYSSSEILMEKYDLVAVLTHTGPSMGFGHYVADVKCFDGHWCRTDDEKRSKITLPTSLTNKAYMLFYQKRTPLLDYDEVSQNFEIEGAGTKEGRIEKNGGITEGILKNVENIIMGSVTESNNGQSGSVADMVSLEELVDNQDVLRLSDTEAPKPPRKKLMKCCTIA